MPVKKIEVEVNPKIHQLKIFTQKFLIGNLSSLYITAIRGQGMEFDGYRVYSINDDAKEIDWKATLRSQDVMVKKFIEERNLNVFFLFDTSNSMLFSSTGKLKAEYAAELIASFAFIVLENQDHVGLSMFSDEIINRVKLGQGTKQYMRIISELKDPKHYGGGFDLENALKLTFQFIRKKAILVIVSDFIGLKGDWQTYVAVAAEKYDIVPIMIRDPHDREFPQKMGQIIVEDPFSDQQILINPDEINDEFVSNVFSQENSIKKVFQDLGIKMMDLQTDQDFVTGITKYFTARLTKRAI